MQSDLLDYIAKMNISFRDREFRVHAKRKPDVVWVIREQCEQPRILRSLAPKVFGKRCSSDRDKDFGPMEVTVWVQFLEFLAEQMSYTKFAVEKQRKSTYIFRKLLDDLVQRVSIVFYVRPCKVVGGIAIEVQDSQSFLQGVARGLGNDAKVFRVSDTPRRRAVITHDLHRMSRKQHWHAVAVWSV